MRSGIFLGTVLAFIVFLLAGCGNGNTTTNPDLIYHKGFEGLKFDFMGSSPPDTVYMGDDFNVLLFVENKGAFDVGKVVDEKGKELEDNYALLDATYDQFYLSREDDKGDAQGRQHIYLRGKSQYYPRGDGLLVEYYFKAKQVPGQREAPKTPMIFTLCYPYRTELAKDVCIDTDYYNMDPRAKVCTIKDIMIGDGQGAPIAVTKIETRAINRNDGTVIEFLITIENKAGGNVISRDPLKPVETQCTEAKTDKDNWDSLIIEAELMGKPLKCGYEEGTGSGAKRARVKLRDNIAKVRCTSVTGVDTNVYTREDGQFVDVGTARNFVSTLYLTLDYLYQESHSKYVELLRLQ